MQRGRIVNRRRRDDTDAAIKALLVITTSDRLSPMERLTKGIVLLDIAYRSCPRPIRLLVWAMIVSTLRWFGPDIPDEVVSGVWEWSRLEGSP